MAQISEITLKDITLVPEFRIDAECYNSEYLRVDEILSKFSSSTVGTLSKSVINFGAYSLCNYINFLKSGEPFIVTNDIENNLINTGNLHYISEEVHELLKKSHCKKGQVLLTMAGAYLGQSSTYYLDFVASSNQAIAKITLKENSVDPFYLSTFFNCRYGQIQISRLRTGTGQPNLNLGLIKTLKVPIFNKDFQQKVRRLVLEGIEESNRCSSLYAQAEKLLLQELGLEDFTPEWIAGYETDHDNVLEVARMDAEYFQPRYRMIEEKVESVALPLSELCTIRRGSMISMDFYNEDNGTPYLRGADFSAGEIGENKLVFIDDSFKKSNEVIVKTNDIIFASIGSVGTSALVDPNFNGSFISNNTGRLRIKSKEILPEYLQIVFQSLIGQIQFERQQTQTAQPKISIDQIGAMKIPVLNMNKQLEISKLVIESFESKNESRQLLEQAKREVEERIEGQ